MCSQDREDYGTDAGGRGALLVGQLIAADAEGSGGINEDWLPGSRPGPELGRDPVQRKLGGQHANDARIVSRPPDQGLAEAAQPRALMRRLTSHHQEQSGRCELSLPELNGLGAARFLLG